MGGGSKKLPTMGKGLSKIQKNLPASFVDGPNVKTHLSLSSIMKQEERGAHKLQITLFFVSIH